MSLIVGLPLPTPALQDGVDPKGLALAKAKGLLAAGVTCVLHNLNLAYISRLDLCFP